MSEADDITKLEQKIRRALNRHLREIGYVRDSKRNLIPPNVTKDSIRELHSKQRSVLLRSEKNFLHNAVPSLINSFAEGKDVVPKKISPRLELVYSESSPSDLFRLASLSWSVPVSRGYGRRMRYLVWDDYNDKLIGIFALGDPVFNLSVRDNLIGWTPEQRAMRLVGVMDAYVLGAVPPYNMLLGGKLIASLIRSLEIKKAFSKKYGETEGIISGEKKHADLALVTTSSSLGKSSIYNRLKLNGTNYFEAIGYTRGWGHFHIPDRLFDDMRMYLEDVGHPYAHENKYGSGPNWRLRTVRTALNTMGVKGDLLRHGILREVYLCRMASNSFEYLRGDHKRAKYADLASFQSVGQQALERWVIPRSQRMADYKAWSANEMLHLFK